MYYFSLFHKIRFSVCHAHKKVNSNERGQFEVAKNDNSELMKSFWHEEITNGFTYESTEDKFGFFFFPQHDAFKLNFESA